MSTRRWWLWAGGAAVVAALVVAVLVWGGDDGVDTAGSPETTTTASTTSTSTSTTASTSTTSTSTTEPATRPGSVTVLSAGPGGGSEEVAVDWDAVTGATGYRILRSATAAGPWVASASLDVTNGNVGAEAHVVNLWSEEHVYVPDRGALSAPDTSPRFHYVEVAGMGERCFLVVAFNAAGDGPESSAVCGSPP